MIKWQRPKYFPCLPLGDNNSKITECEKHIELSRVAATEGTVLLKNKHSLLPLKKGTKVAIFGKGQIDYVKGGGGSGDVYCSYVRNIYQGLKMKSAHLDVFDSLSLYYQEYVEAKYKEGATPGMFDEAPVSGELLSKAKEYADTAIIVINRYSRENEDRRNDETDNYFYLTEAEQVMVSAVTDNFEHIVVLLNVGAMIDTSWFAYNDRIAAAVALWQGGMEGGLAAADILVGDANPSGKLVDSCAKSFDDYPSSEGFHESDDYVKYTEDIFVGYRYFETIPDKKDCIVYPFGYGLSYTTFTLSDIHASLSGENILATVKVTNTGSCAGKEVVQLYYSAPTGKLDKPARELCGFAKTKALKPGESDILHITFAINDMASYDDMGAIATSCYVLEKGIYKFHIGTSVRDTQEIDFSYELKDNVIVEQLQTYCAPEKLEKRMKADGTYKEILCVPVERKTFSCDYKFATKPEPKLMVKKVSNNPAEPNTGYKPVPYSLLDVADGLIDLDSFIAQMTDEELCHLVGGQPNRGVSRISGMGDLDRLGIPSVMTLDGPAGARIEPTVGLHTTAFPVATALACSWNLNLVETIGHAGALEIKENNICIWLTPALNIHRSPLCGRNFEYYSEDPFVAGKMAAAMVKGIQAENIVAVPKHFACNNKETKRMDSDSILSERALREIYLKGFEICVKEAKPKMIMTSYNYLNGIYASENAELLEGILRGEWQYKGMVTTDWWNHADHVREIQAGNDVKMPRGQYDKILDALNNGEITREQLAVCVKRILEMILWLE